MGSLEIIWKISYSWITTNKANIKLLFPFDFDFFSRFIIFFKLKTFLKNISYVLILTISILIFDFF